MKKLFAFVLSLVMVLSLCAACGGNQTETPNTGDDNGIPHQATRRQVERKLVGRNLEDDDWFGRHRLLLGS